MLDLEWPFLGSEALAAKAVPERAMRALYEAVYPRVYVPWGVELTARQRACAAWLWSRRRAVVAGNSAAALLGTKWVSPTLDAELVHDNRKPPARILVRTDTLAPREIQVVDGIAVTTPARTAFDIGRRTTSRLQAIQRLDALTNATDVTLTDVEAVIAEHSGARGLVRLLRVLPLVDGGTESPQETRTRLVLIDAGLPRPQTQIRCSTNTGTSLPASTWGTRICGSALSTTDRNTGQTVSSATGISTGIAHCPIWAGRSSGSVASCSDTDRARWSLALLLQCRQRDGARDRDGRV